MPKTRCFRMKGCIYVVLFICSYLVVARIAGETVQAQNCNPRCSVASGVPYYFSVLIVSPSHQDHSYKAQIVRYPNIKEYTRATPGWSFQVPNNQEADLIRQLAHQSNNAKSNGVDSQLDGEQGIDSPTITSFKIKELSDRKQQIELMSSDGIIRSFYIANSRSIIPKFCSIYTGKRDTLYAVGALIGGFINIVLWLLAFGFARLLRYFRKPHIS